MADATTRVEVAVPGLSSPGWGKRAFAFSRRWPVVPGTILFIVIFAAVFAPLVSPADPQDYDLRGKNIPPFWYAEGSANHLLGTDVLGRDLLSRMIHGARISLMVAAISLGTGVVIGTTLGLMAGYFGGLVDEAITRLVDIWIGIPFIMVALVVAFILGASVATIALLLVLLAWTPYVRQVRAEVLSLKTREYVLAARVAGASTTRIFVKHLVPGVLGLILVVATFQVASLILTEAFLSFLGAGIPPPTPSWGNMISEGRNFLRDAWWIAMFPGLAILVTTMSMSFMGDWVRDFVDPRLRQLE